MHIFLIKSFTQKLKNVGVETPRSAWLNLYGQFTAWLNLYIQIDLEWCERALFIVYFESLVVYKLKGALVKRLLP